MALKSPGQGRASRREANVSVWGSVGAILESPSLSCRAVQLLNRVRPLLAVACSALQKVPKRCGNGAFVVPQKSVAPPLGPVCWPRPVTAVFSCKHMDGLTKTEEEGRFCRGGGRKRRAKLKNEEDVRRIKWLQYLTFQTKSIYLLK